MHQLNLDTEKNQRLVKFENYNTHTTHTFEVIPHSPYLNQRYYAQHLDPHCAMHQKSHPQTWRSWHVLSLIPAPLNPSPQINNETYQMLPYPHEQSACHYRTMSKSMESFFDDSLTIREWKLRNNLSHPQLIAPNGL